MIETNKSFDLGRLLAPIAGDSPTGVSLRYDNIYQHIAEARREDDPTLPQGSWERPLKRADWIRVDALCTEALVQKTKDIQIAAWLAEAWMHLHGLEGLVSGLELIDSLCKEDWDAIHPQVVEDDVDYRVAPFAWINDNLALGLRRAVPIVEDASRVSEAKLTLADWVNALRLENSTLKDASVAKLAEQERTPTRAIFNSSASLTSPAFFRRLYQDIARCDAAVTALEQLMLEKLKDDSPGLSRIREALGEMRNAVRELGGESVGREPEKVEAGAAGGDTSSSSSIAESAVREGEMAESDTNLNESARPSGSGPITSREDAFRRLNEAADYLMRIEPHSPCPYLVKRAVAWGKMPLTELLQEMVRSEGDLQELYGMLGMRPWKSGEPK